MAELKFLDQYSGQSVNELIDMEREYRIDSLVLAFEAALDRKVSNVGISKLSETEKNILAVEALEREVNNGGYDQFFMNSSKDYADIIVKALNTIKCPKTAGITQQAINYLEISGPITSEAIEEVMNKDIFGEGKLTDELGKFDDLYYDSDEPIEDRLFEYIKKNRADIRF